MLLHKNTCCFIWYVRENFSKLNQGTDAVRQFKSKIRDMFIVGNDGMKETGGQAAAARLLQNLIKQPSISKKARLTSVSPPRSQVKRNTAFKDDEARWVSCTDVTFFRKI